MKHLMVVLDSCRYDLFNQLYKSNELPFFQQLGEPVKSYTNCNITPASFVLFFSHGIFPYPKPKGFRIKRQINFIQNMKEYSLVMSNVSMLWTKHTSVASTMASFDKATYHKQPEICMLGVKTFNTLSDMDDLFFVIWCRETHHPYEYEIGQTDWKIPLINAYNRGKDVLPDGYIEYLKDRQREMIKYCDQTLRRIKTDGNTRISILADHGESIGEGHRIGHGHAFHPVMFEIPFQSGIL